MNRVNGDDGKGNVDARGRESVVIDAAGWSIWGNDDAYEMVWFR